MVAPKMVFNLAFEMSKSDAQFATDFVDKYHYQFFTNMLQNLFNAECIQFKSE